jgi:hypothetical protein
MSRHWNPDDDLARAPRTRALPRLPVESIDGLAMVAAACVRTAVLLYKLAGPRDLFGS